MSYKSAYTGAQIDNGAVVESGSNANGEFTKWADGTVVMMIKKTPSALAITSANTGGGFRSGQQNFTLPTTCVVATSVVCSSVANNSDGVESVAAIIATTTGYYALKTTVNSIASFSGDIDIMVIGRWV